MKRLLARIAERKTRFAGLALFRRLEGPGDVGDVAAFAPGLTFFVMAFQDVLRLNAARVRDPELARIARQHRDEDAGHEHWFLHDLQQLGSDVGVAWLFGPEHASTRDAAYALVAEALAAEHDAARMAILLSLEATGDALFRRAPAFLERAGNAPRMMYFSRRHHEVENAHDLHDQELAATLGAIVLEPEAYAAVAGTVERTFDAMEAMVAHLEARVVAARRARATSASTTATATSTTARAGATRGGIA